MAERGEPRKQAVRVAVAGVADPSALVARTVARAGTAAALGWVRDDGGEVVCDGGGEPVRDEGGVVHGRSGLVRAHVEGAPDAVSAVVELLTAAGSDAVVERVKVEGHEQFAVRGVSAGRFVVAEHQASSHHYDLRLEVEGVLRSWALPRGPSLDPAAKRLAVAVADHDLVANSSESEPNADGRGSIIWDQGSYEQGGRVRWPEALERGHAVFVLHGHKLKGGFALQRTGRAGAGRRSDRGETGPAGRAAEQPGGAAEQWLLIKRRDEWARPGSDIVAERPESVLSGRTLRGADPTTGT